jgi:hypothetical protein
VAFVAKVPIAIGIYAANSPPSTSKLSDLPLDFVTSQQSLTDMHHLDSILFFFTLILLISCGDKVEEVPSMGEYDFPTDPEIAERTYTYVRHPGTLYEADTLVYSIVTTDPVRKRYALTIRENAVTVGERIFEINNDRKKLIAEYAYEDDDEKIECEIVQYETTNVGHRLPGLKSKTKYINREGKITTNYEEERKIADTTAIWKGEERKALKIEYTQITKEKMKYLPFIVDTYEFDGTATYVEGIGLFKWTFQWAGVEYNTELLSIRNLKRDLVSGKMSVE